MTRTFFTPDPEVLKSENAHVMKFGVDSSHPRRRRAWKSILHTHPYVSRVIWKLSSSFPFLLSSLSVQTWIFFPYRANISRFVPSFPNAGRAFSEMLRFQSQFISVSNQGISIASTYALSRPKSNAFLYSAIPTLQSQGSIRRVDPNSWALSLSHFRCHNCARVTFRLGKYIAPIIAWFAICLLGLETPPLFPPFQTDLLKTGWYFRPLKMLSREASSPLLTIARLLLLYPDLHLSRNRIVEIEKNTKFLTPKTFFGNYRGAESMKTYAFLFSREFFRFFALQHWTDTHVITAYASTVFQPAEYYGTDPHKNWGFNETPSTLQCRKMYLDKKPRAQITQ